MIIKKLKYPNSVFTPTNLKKLQAFSWCSKILAFLVVKNKLISFHNRFKPSFPNLLTPSTKNANIFNSYLLQSSLVSNGAHKKDEAKFKNASKTMHFQILPHLFFLCHQFALCYLLCPMFYTNTRFACLLFHTLQITLFCSHRIPKGFS